LGRSDAAIILMRKIWLRELRALSEGRLPKKWSLLKQSSPAVEFNHALAK
jgi:hypothetical protein